MGVYTQKKKFESFLLTIEYILWFYTIFYMLIDRTCFLKYYHVIKWQSPGTLFVKQRALVL